MTDRIFFDTDCLSAFLWARGESILSRLYAGRITLPVQVYDELKRVPHLLARVDRMRSRDDLTVDSMEAGSAEYRDYLKMITAPESGIRIIGRGEAAGIAMARERGGILGSNNLRDIVYYVGKYGLQHITTGDILMEALHSGIISETEGDEIWANMLRKRRMLGAAAFTDYMKMKTNNGSIE